MAVTAPAAMPSTKAARSRNRAQRRLHLVVAVIGRHVFVGQREVVRRGFAGDREAMPARVVHHGHRVARRDVGHVVARSGQLGQHQVAGHHHVFRSGGDAAQSPAHRAGAFVHVAARAQVQVLAVLDDRQSVGAGELHGAAHDAGVHHRQPVIGNGHRSSGFHGADGGQFFAGASLGDGADGEHVHRRQPPCALHDVTGDGGTVVHRLGVGHGADGCEPAGRRRARAALDGFGVLEARLAQVDMHVDEAGGHYQAGGIEDFARRARPDSAPRPRCGHRRSARRRCSRFRRRGRSRGRCG